MTNQRRYNEWIETIRKRDNESSSGCYFFPFCVIIIIINYYYPFFLLSLIGYFLKVEVSHDLAALQENPMVFKRESSHLLAAASPHISCWKHVEATQ